MASYNSIMLDIRSEGVHIKQKLMQEKYTKNARSRQCSSCVVSCLKAFNHGNKLCSSVSEPSSAFSGVARSQEVFCKRLQHTFPAALAHE